MAKAKPKRSGVSRLLIYSFLLIAMAVYNYTVPHRFNDIDIAYSNKIFDRNGIFIGYTFAENFYNQNAKDKAIAINQYTEVPPLLIRALMAVEDKALKNDWQNRLGFRLKGLARSVFSLGRKGGGSGVFQQLVKNLFLNSEGGANRKITEWQIASAMYLNYNWEDLVVLYLNNVSFGENIRGFKAAAAYFFSKALHDCTIPEIAMLVGMLNGPNRYYNPHNTEANKDKNKLAFERKNFVLHQMQEDSIITENDFRQFRILPIRFTFDTDLSRQTTAKTQQFNEYVRTELNSISQATRTDSNLTNLNVYTTFDIKAQEAAESLIREYWGKTFKGRMRDAQIALVSIESSVGGIVTMVGGNPSSPWTGSNRCIRLYKQVGSAFKPFFYGAMFEKGFPLTYTLPDKELPSGFYWKAKNSNGTFSNQDLTLLECITQSKNVPVCYAMNKGLVTPIEIKSIAGRCGIREHLPDNLQIAIGGLTAGVSPLEMASAYAVIANNGYYLPVHAITKITTANRKREKSRVIYQFDLDTARKRAIESSVASNLRTCLESVVNRGTASAVRQFYSGYAAGKTGTTDDNKDAWFVGFNEIFSTAVWVGFDDNKSSLPLEYNQGGKIAAPLWGAYMNRVGRKRKS